MFPKGIRDSWQVKAMPSLLRSLALTLKMLNTKKPHNSVIMGIVMLPEYRKTPENSKTDTSDSSGVRNRALGVGVGANGRYCPGVLQESNVLYL